MRDGFGRPIHYLRLSVTDRCDFRCSYCLPRSHRGFATPADWLTVDETVRLIRIFADLGVTHVRLTGGEPLVRQELTAIAAAIAAVPGIGDLSMSTNASRVTPASHRSRSTRWHCAASTTTNSRTWSATVCPTT
jgi:cyclic pyranopterin phosphate synthase